jgi:pilus assembly protein FimV
VRRPVAAVEPPVEEPSFFAGIIDAVKEFWWLPVGLLAVIGGLFGYRKWQSGRAADLDDTFVGYDNAAASEMTMPRVPSDTAKLRRPNIASPAERTGVVVEESGEYEAPRLDAQRAEAAQTISAEDTFSGETGINLDQGDPLAEADFHMAYGLYDQAADLVRLAVAREPERRDLQLKLAEVYFVWGNKEEFLNAARVLQKTQAEGAPGEWEKVVIMGRQIAPEDPLFASASVRAAGAAGAAVDLRLDGGDGPIDFDVFGDGTGSTVEKPRLTTTDLDIGASLGDNEATGERLGIDTAEINMGADAPTQVMDAGGATTREMSPRFAATGTGHDLDADLGIDLGAATSPDISDAPTVEQPSLRAGSPTIRAKLDAARRISAADETAEVPIDDLGLDLGDAPGLDAPDAGEAADAPTLVARMDDDSQRLMALAAKGSGASQQDQDTGATSMIAAIDLSQFDQTGTHEVNGGSLDLDIGSPTMTDLKPPKLSADAGSEDLTLPSLEPVTISEVGTKLDLARAYMDMGDPDGARNILNEVLHEGSVSQKQEAQRLLESLPG